MALDPALYVGQTSGGGTTGGLAFGSAGASGLGYGTFGTTTGGSKRKKKGKEGHGLIGHLEEVIRNTGGGLDAAFHGVVPQIENIGSSVYYDITHPHGLATGENPFSDKAVTGSAIYRNIIKPQAKALAYKYGPAFHGDFGETLHRVEEDPFGTALDFLTIFTLGAGRAAALGLTPAELGTAARVSAAVTGKYGGPAREIKLSTGAGEVVARTLPRSGYRAKRMELTDAALKKLPPEWAVIGEFARAGRTLLRDALPEELRNRSKEVVSEYARAMNAGTKDERVAAAVIGRLSTDESYLRAWKNQLAFASEFATPAEVKIAEATLKRLDREQFTEAYRSYGSDTPQGKRVTRIVDAGRDLSKAREDLLHEANPDATGSFDAAPYGHIRVASGAEILTQGRFAEINREIERKLKDIELEVGRRPKVDKRGRTIKKGKQGRILREAKQAAGRQAVEGALRTERQLEPYAARNVSYRERLSPYAESVDELGQAVHDLKAERDALASGSEMSTEQMARFGVSAPRPSTGGGMTSMEQALERATRPPGTTDAKLLAQIDDDLAKARQRLEIARGRVEAFRPPTTGLARVSHAKNVTEYRRLAGMGRRTPAEEARYQELKLRTRHNVSTEADAQREAIAARAEVRRLEELKASPPVETVEPPYRQGMEVARDQLLGKMADALHRTTPTGQAKGLLAEYEKALVAEWAHAKAMMEAEDIAAAQGVAKNLTRQTREFRIHQLQALRKRFVSLREAQHELLAERAHAEEHVGSLFGGPTIDAIRGKLEQEGRPLPYYLPDEMAKRRGTSTSARHGTGLTPPAHDIRQSKHLLFRLGALALDPDVLTPAYMRAVQYAYRVDLHERVRAVATPYQENEGLPHDMRWVREVRGEKIPHVYTQAGEHQEAGARVFPEEYDKLTIPGGKPVDLSEIARDEKGMRLAVPARLANTLEQDFKRSSAVGRLLVTKPLQFWRALVLHTNPNWLTNNIVGNGLLWTMRFAGVGGMRAFLGMVAETKGARGVRQLLNLPETRNALTLEDMEELFPRQRHGTAVETQFPERNRMQTLGRKFEEPLPLGKLNPKRWSARDIAGSPFRALPTVDRATEGAFRRAGLNKMLRESPEAKAFYKGMPKQTANWREAMRHAAKDPAVARAAEREVDDALGSYLSLEPWEKGYMRQVVPFYAWFREITRIVMKMPLDIPLRTNIAYKLSKVQDERMQDLLGDLPSYLRGVIPLGPPRGGQQNVIALQAANPYGTVPTLARAIKLGLFGGGPEFQPGLYEAAGMVNPFLGAAVRGRDQGFYNAVKENVFQSLPAYRAGFGPTKSSLYPDRTRVDAILRYLGYPVRTYDVSTARKYAEEGS